ncbi:hypothetical protein DICPUDRAFT_97652 [Dictyostelium purpureum]|uniref:Splicing factor ESS-2 homolog n=1 Tax=Dictyostelium purpureum TaxID=5786 RepID=F0ZIL4_DICPU|nr:uncharacterized protein DICPUDRAFT_97652 [Dictyostelium purpureum]EGC36208.1 hypothetical protein DICPUDRAFT_97652 [Dictyostelium purpureum]|eukprot:XP_003287275.1 hypothetical protein DICPUDRAFT_97652 [Dictyostelium purpureum]
MSNNNKKLNIVNEEKYVESLNKIIQRDFFPDLPNLKSQLEWMDAVESNDLDRMKTVQLTSLKRVATSRTPYNNSFDTPAINNNNSNGFETPQVHNHTIANSNTTDNNNTEQNNEIDNTNLDSFVNTYISEDDASYIEIQKKQNEKILIKYKWLFDKANEINKKQQLLLDSSSTETKLLTSSSSPNNTAAPSLSVVEYKSNPNTAPNSWNYKVKNQLMYIPDTNYNKEVVGGPPKEIKHNNTRITEKLWEDDVKPQQTQRIPTNKPFSQMTLQEQIEKLKQMEFEGKSTMEIESSMLGYISTPQIIPGGRDDESPLMTWGRVDGTPLLLDSNPISTPLDTKFKSGTPSFKIPETPKREQLANKMVDKIVNKTLNKNTINTPASLSNLSPAAQKYILQKRSGSQTPSSPHDQLRKSYQLTPSPIRKSNKLQQTPTPTKSANTPIKNITKTPNIKSSTSIQNTPTTTSSSITDNLLDFT